MGSEDNERDEMEGFGQSVEVKAKRKIRARTVDESVWNWLGMMGLVGWSVTAPTVVGVFLGRWIDQRWPSTVSWTLTMLLAGVGVGCATAWFWVGREGRRG